MNVKKVNNVRFLRKYL